MLNNQMLNPSLIYKASKTSIMHNNETIITSSLYCHRVYVQRNTFQLILTSDSQRHVIIFHYGGISHKGTVKALINLDFAMLRLVYYHLWLIFFYSDCSLANGKIYPKRYCPFPSFWLAYVRNLQT